MLFGNSYSFGFIVPTALTNVDCMGDEDTIFECITQAVNKDASCSHNDDLIISCFCEFCCT